MPVGGGEVERQRRIRHHGQCELGEREPEVSTVGSSTVSGTAATGVENQPVPIPDNVAAARSVRSLPSRRSSTPSGATSSPACTSGPCIAGTLGGYPPA